MTRRCAPGLKHLSTHRPTRGKPERLNCGPSKQRRAPRVPERRPKAPAGTCDTAGTPGRAPRRFGTRSPPSTAWKHSGRCRTMRTAAPRSFPDGRSTTTGCRGACSRKAGTTMSRWPSSLQSACGRGRCSTRSTGRDRYGIRGTLPSGSGGSCSRPSPRSSACSWIRPWTMSDGAPVYESSRGWSVENRKPNDRLRWRSTMRAGSHRRSPASTTCNPRWLTMKPSCRSRSGCGRPTRATTAADRGSSP